MFLLHPSTAEQQPKVKERGQGGRIYVITCRNLSASALNGETRTQPRFLQAGQTSRPEKAFLKLHSSRRCLSWLLLWQHPARMSGGCYRAGLLPPLFSYEIHPQSNLQRLQSAKSKGSQLSQGYTLSSIPSKAAFLKPGLQKLKAQAAFPSPPSPLTGSHPVLPLLPRSQKLSGTKQMNNFSSPHQNPGPCSHSRYRFPGAESLVIIFSHTIRLSLSLLPFQAY